MAANSQFVWTRSETLALASQRCSICFGLGLRAAKGIDVPCSCVLRAIFRACYARFSNLVREEQSRGLRPRMLEADTAHNRSRAAQLGQFGYKRSEYCADFLLIARRALEQYPRFSRVFKYHFILGADFRLCNRKLGRPLNDRCIFHDFYAIQAIVGKALRETQPYALFPVYEYFGQAPPIALCNRQLPSLALAA